MDFLVCEDAKVPFADLMASISSVKGATARRSSEPRADTIKPQGAEQAVRAGSADHTILTSLLEPAPRGAAAHADGLRADASTQTNRIRSRRHHNGGGVLPGSMASTPVGSRPASATIKRPPSAAAHYSVRPSSAGSARNLRKDMRPFSAGSTTTASSRRTAPHVAQRSASTPTLLGEIASPTVQGTTTAPHTPAAARPSGSLQRCSSAPRHRAASCGSASTRSRTPSTKGFAAQNARRDVCHLPPRPASLPLPVGSMYGPVAPKGATCAQACADLQQWPTHWCSKVMVARGVA